MELSPSLLQQDVSSVSVVESDEKEGARGELQEDSEVALGLSELSEILSLDEMIWYSLAVEGSVCPKTLSS